MDITPFEHAAVTVAVELPPQTPSNFRFGIAPVQANAAAATVVDSVMPFAYEERRPSTIATAAGIAHDAPAEKEKFFKILHSRIVSSLSMITNINWLCSTISSSLARMLKLNIIACLLVSTISS